MVARKTDDLSHDVLRTLVHSFQPVPCAMPFDGRHQDLWQNGGHHIAYHESPLLLELEVEQIQSLDADVDPENGTSE